MRTAWDALPWYRSVALAAGLFVAALIGQQAMAPAAIPDPDGTIWGCRATADGQLRVVDVSAGENCGDDEKLIVWNVGFYGYEEVVLHVDSDQYGQAVGVARCPSGKKVLGGGYGISSPDTGRAGVSGPADGYSWLVWFFELSPSQQQAASVYVLCAVVAE